MRRSSTIGDLVLSPNPSGFAWSWQFYLVPSSSRQFSIGFVGMVDSQSDIGI
jgi:hypothetical protein